MSVILNISLNAYNDGWGYQENLLPKYQALLGNDVILITITKKYDGVQIVDCESADFQSVDGYRVIRVKTKQFLDQRMTDYLNYSNIYHYINEIKPNLIFFHSLNCMTIIDAMRYKKNNCDCIIVQDNHLDYNNGYNPHKSVKHFFMALMYRTMYRFTDKYISKVYGVTPCREEYAHKVFGIKSEKIDLLVMGADDFNIEYSKRDKIRSEIREELSIDQNSFVIITGGKVDNNKPEIFNVVEAVGMMPDVELILFGIVSEEYKDRFKELDKRNCHFLGWIDSKEIFKYFFASDLGVFPGLHSVMWEQACACNLPCVFRYLEGMNHLWDNGNAIAITRVDGEYIKQTILELVRTEKYYELLQNAKSDKMKSFRYSEIAKKSIETLQ